MKRINANAVIVHSSEGQVSAKSLGDLSKASKENGIEVIYILSVPRWSFHVPQTLFEMNEEALWEKYQQKNIEDYRVQIKEHQREIQSLETGNIKVIPVAEDLCTPQCRIMSNDGTPLYYDAHHLTLTGAQKIRPSLKPIFQSE